MKIELELFYNECAVAVRAAQAEYLTRVKSVAFPQELPEVEEISAEEYASLRFWARRRYRKQLKKQLKRYKKALRAQKSPVDEVLTKGYNGGIELSLKVLNATFLLFMKRLEEEEK